jgi:23S rRNA (uridine2552-2'-O)-methyltransferase
MPGTYNRKDELYHRAKKEGYRGRAAYKLIELNKRFKIFKRGMSVCDLGCAPGGWLQVSADLISPDGVVVGIDLEKVEDVSDLVTIFCGDLTTPENKQLMIEALGGSADVVLSDMSPDISGIKLRDSFRSAELVEHAWLLSQEILKKGGSFVAKIFPGAECESLAKEIRPKFQKFSRVCLESSRKTSTELYFVGQGFGLGKKS